MTARPLTIANDPKHKMEFFKSLSLGDTFNVDARLMTILGFVEKSVICVLLEWGVGE